MNLNQVSWIELHAKGGAEIDRACIEAEILADDVRVDVVLHFNEHFWWFLPERCTPIPPLVEWPVFIGAGAMMLNRVERRSSNG